MYGKFHTQGEAVVAPKESQFLAFTATKAVLEAVGKLQKVIISPLPRHLFNSCCQDPDHCTNIRTAGYREETESAIMASRKNLKDFCFRHNIRGCKVICPRSSITRRAYELWTSLDPIHMTTVGFDLVAGMVLEAYAGGTDKHEEEAAALPGGQPEQEDSYVVTFQSMPSLQMYSLSGLGTAFFSV